MKIPLAQITLTDRQRKTYDNIEELKSSLQSVGQITPILVTRDGPSTYAVVAGGRRYTAATQLNWQEIEAYVREDLTPLERKELEFEENNPLTRRNLLWHEACIAVAELHLLKSLAHGFSTADNGWTQAKMAAFTGYSTGSISTMLKVAEVLKSCPDDKELYSCSSWREAAALLITRTAKEVEDEINRRRVLTKPAIHVLNQPVNPGLVFKTSDIATPPSLSPLHSVRPTEQEQTRERVYLQGRNRYIEEADFEKTELSNCFTMAVGTGPAPLNLAMFLRPEGYAVIWHVTDPMVMLPCAPVMLRWNKVLTEANPWRFSGNYLHGRVYSPTIPTIPQPGITCTISAIDDKPGYLPLAVLDYSISPFCSEGLAVLCLNGVDPVDILELGRVPVWYEPDKVKYDRTLARVRVWYETNIPGVEVILP